MPGVPGVGGRPGLAPPDPNASCGLEPEFVPSEEVALTTLRRLFPWAPGETEAWKTLLWANGRADLPGQERQTGWRRHCAPPSEWDGTNPRRAGSR
ncbi:hypothetical protein AB0H88_19275 [Nonomuraea sp. NPDC050680]|uniref:hypothetical protein n=1 Tax=Nonomuraea sp. NPDC050680 TaxID=3154630 RepID=UPI0033D9F800